MNFYPKIKLALTLKTILPLNPTISLNLH